MKLGTLEEMIKAHGALAPFQSDRTKWPKYRHQTWSSDRWFAPIIMLKSSPASELKWWVGVQWAAGEETSGLFESDGNEFWVLYEQLKKRYAWELRRKDAISHHWTLEDVAPNFPYSGGTLHRLPLLDYEVKE